MFVAVFCGVFPFAFYPGMHLRRFYGRFTGQWSIFQGNNEKDMLKAAAHYSKAADAYKDAAELYFDDDEFHACESFRTQSNDV